MEMVLIGYAWPRPPKVVCDSSFQAREALWHEGYSVDAIPQTQALEIENVFMSSSGLRPENTGL